MREPYYLQRELDRQRERVRELEADVKRLRAQIDAVLACQTWNQLRYDGIESARAPLSDTRSNGEYILSDDVLDALQVPR